MSRGKHDSKQEQQRSRRAALTSLEGPSARELRYLQKEQQRQHETTTTSTTSHTSSDGTTTTSRRRRRVRSSRGISSSTMMMIGDPDSASTTTATTIEDTSFEKQQRNNNTTTTRHPNNQRPLLRPGTSTHIVAVSEDSCLSDHSSSCDNTNHKRKIAQKKKPKAAPKKKARAAKHSLKISVRVVAPKETTVRRTQRPRVATQFFIPRNTAATMDHGPIRTRSLAPSSSSVLALSQRREKRRRVAPEFFNLLPAAKRVRRSTQPNPLQPPPTTHTTKSGNNSRRPKNAVYKSGTHRGSSRHVAFEDDNDEDDDDDMEDESYSNHNEEEYHPQRRSSLRRHGANNQRPATRSSAKKDSTDKRNNNNNSLKRRLRSAQQQEPTPGLVHGEEHDPEMDPPVEHAALRTENPAVSLDALLSRYECLARAGRVEPVRFGTSLDTAQTAIERKLRELGQKHPASRVPDVEVTEDIKAYRRSLRAFKDFEDQEKLALEEDYEVVVEAWRRRGGGGGRRKPNHEKVEEANLAHRPLVFSQHRRIPARHSQCTQPCGLCHAAAPTAMAPLETLVPGMRRIDIDKDDIDDDNNCRPTTSTRRTTITKSTTQAPAPARVSTRSADVTLKVQRTRRQLEELQHSLTFVDEYAAGWFGY